MEKWKKDLQKIVETNPNLVTPRCDYCGSPARLVDGDYIYPHRPDLFKKKFWQCANGHPEAYVGCHPDSTKPLGRLADEDLRSAKKDTHNVFDPIWREKYSSRNRAYQWLAGRMGIPSRECHIGMFTLKQCEQARLIVAEELEYLRKAKTHGYTVKLRYINKNKEHCDD